MDTTTTVIEICPIAELPAGDARRIESEPPIAVFNIDGVLYAIDDTCTHADASLADGYLDGCFVQCPYHLAPFDLRTGRPTSLPATKPVRTHTVEVRDDVIVVLLGVPPVNPGTPVAGSSAH
jgi:3-phenylpropionate/trans-cinnamate dioxygenase ferredoxin subunit